jgi:hypothetical protein
MSSPGTVSATQGGVATSDMTPSQAVGTNALNTSSITALGQSIGMGNLGGVVAAAISLAASNLGFGAITSPTFSMDVPGIGTINGPTIASLIGSLVGQAAPSVAPGVGTITSIAQGIGNQITGNEISQGLTAEAAQAAQAAQISQDVAQSPQMAQLATPVTNTMGPGFGASLAAIAAEGGKNALSGYETAQNMAFTSFNNAMAMNAVNAFGPNAAMTMSPTGIAMPTESLASAAAMANSPAYAGNPNQSYAGYSLGPNGYFFANQQGPRCFTADTEVCLPDGTWVPIEKIKAGDTVLSRDWQNGQEIPMDVTKVVAGRSRGDLMQVNGVKVTKQHRFAVGVDRWKRAFELKVGDVILGLADARSTVMSIVKGLPDEPIFNLNAGQWIRWANFIVRDAFSTYVVHNGAGYSHV